MNCGRCRRPLQDGAQWCSFCGTPVATVEAPAAVAPQVTAPLPEPPAPPPPPPAPPPAPTSQPSLTAAPPVAGSAIAALVFGIFGLFGPMWLLGPLLALGFARRARREIAQAQGELGGWQVARAARILAWTSLVLLLIVLALFALVLVWSYSTSDSGTLFGDGGFFSTPSP